MFNDHDHRNKRRKVFMDSIEALATLLAALAAFLATPEAYSRTVNWVVRYASSRYGAGFEDLIAMGWFVMTALIIFFGARATLATAIVAAGLAAAVRFLMDAHHFLSVIATQQNCGRLPHAPQKTLHHRLCEPEHRIGCTDLPVEGDDRGSEHILVA